MKIILFGATGNLGQRIASEALDRGHEVIGVVRDTDEVVHPDDRLELADGDATNPASVAHFAAGADAIVNAISPRVNARGLAAPSLTDAAHALIAGARQAGVKRLIVVGGAGSLEVSPGLHLVDSPGFPEPYRPEARAQREALETYRAEAADLDWTYISPAAEIRPGVRTGSYRMGNDTLLVDAQGKSQITYEDYAAALVDELEQGRHIRERFTVAY